MFVVIHSCQLSDLVFSRAAALPPVLADVSENIIDEERKLEDDFAKEARLEFCRICFSIDIDSRYLGSVVSPVVAALAGAGRVARADGLQGRVLAQRGVQRLRVRPGKPSYQCHHHDECHHHLPCHGSTWSWILVRAG